MAGISNLFPDYKVLFFASASASAPYKKYSSSRALGHKSVTFGKIFVIYFRVHHMFSEVYTCPIDRCVLSMMFVVNLAPKRLVNPIVQFVLYNIGNYGTGSLKYSPLPFIYCESEVMTH